MTQKGLFTSKKNTLIVESVVPLSQEQINTLFNHLKIDPQHTTLDNIHNSSLVAGIRVIHSGKIIDLSFQNLLNQLADSDYE